MPSSSLISAQRAVGACRGHCAQDSAGPKAMVAGVVLAGAVLAGTGMRSPILGWMEPGVHQPGAGTSIPAGTFPDPEITLLPLPPWVVPSSWPPFPHALTSPPPEDSLKTSEH